MAIDITKVASGDLGEAGSSTTIALTGVNVGAGNGCWVWVKCNSEANSVTGVADGTNTYNKIGTDRLDASGRVVALFYCKNMAAGTFTITATFSSATTQRAISAYKVTGQDPTAEAQTGTGQAQAGAGTGTDAVTTGNMTPSSQPAAVIGVSIDTANTAAIAAGTGFTSLGNIPAFDALLNDASRAEWKRITSVSAVAATFTLAGTDDCLTIGGILSEAPSAPTLTVVGRSVLNDD